MSMTARMLMAYANALRLGIEPQHHFSYTHCARVLAAHLIAEGL